MQQQPLIKCTINGVDLEVKAGTTIIQAMYDNNQKIAHYCWHPGLSIAGVCRLCMVEIEGNPRLQIACNTVVTEGMKINNNSPKVQEAVKWGLDFHLINHPLDCPICDQAGECGLQDQYMEFGQYNSEMAEKKQKKHKVVDLGPTVVLDSERCILCSRCVRFTEEVSKTNELGIFNRGDHAEIGTHAGKPLDNKYSLNTVDICPVGALTSKDFRFRQRVWYLKDSETVCNGCSTGCNVKVYFNKEGMFRVKPKRNDAVNGYWMCDDGRDIYKFVNKENRLLKGVKYSGGTWHAEQHAGAAAKEAYELVKSSSGDEIALVLTGQYTVEEYEAIVSSFVNTYKSKNVYHWWNSESSANEFDGLLIRGDKNPNTQGLKAVLAKHGIQTKFADLETSLNSGKIKNLVVAAPENKMFYTDLTAKLNTFVKAQNLVYLTAGKIDDVQAIVSASNVKTFIAVPVKTFVEKAGTFVNHAGLAQKFKKVTTIVSEALTLEEVATLLTGHEVQVNTLSDKMLFVAEDTRVDQVTLDHRKKNEFVFQRGRL
ncbi:MAG: 2Fe-2S iron-sulfur cluster-binding protein [Pseudobdellovibrio sp.]